MKMMKRLMLVLALFTAAVLCSVKAEAGYKYRVTIEAGLHGTVNGGSTYEAEQFDYNQQWNPNNYQDMIAVSDPKYYFKGFHISGIEGVVGTQYITKDTVFVATYGIKGQTVAYTVEYVDNNGATLFPTQTYYGNIGDKPVVAFRYIEGYVPQAYNITGTLKANAADNVFRFTYTRGTIPGGGGATPAGPGPITYVDDGVTVIGGGAAGGGGAGGGGAGGGGAAAAGGGGAGQAGADNGTGGQEAAPGGTETGTEQPGTPVETIDIDNPDTPLAQPEQSPEASAQPGKPEEQGSTLLSNLWKYGLTGGGFLLLLLLLMLFLRKKDRGDA